MELNYLQSKIQNPRIQPDLVARPHLIEVIEKGLWRKLTILCAPPGFGKSTLIAEWSLKGKASYLLVSGGCAGQFTG